MLTQTFIDQSTSSWLDLPGLESNTTYTVDIRMQLANTSNHNIWSDPNRQTITTLISQPVPEVDNQKTQKKETQTWKESTNGKRIETTTVDRAKNE